MSSGKNIENIPSEGKIISDGLEIAYLDWQATGEVYDNLLVLHPNGFCAGMFDPIASLLSKNYRVVGVDLRGHGASEEVLDEAQETTPEIANTNEASSGEAETLKSKFQSAFSKENIKITY